MALRRTLPSRMPGATASEAKVVSTPAQPAPQPQVSAPAAPQPVPSPNPAPAAAPKPSESELAAAASSAFSTLPAAPARVLEDSFTVAAVPAAPLSDVIIPSVADFQPAAAPEPRQPQSEPEKQPEPAKPEMPQPEPTPVPQPEIPAPTRQPEVPQPQPEPAPAPVQEPLRAAPREIPADASRPDNNPLKRRVGGNGNGNGSRNSGNRQPGQPRTENTPPVQAAPQAAAPAQPSAPAQTAAPQTAEATARNRVKRQRDFAAATIAAPVAEPARPSAGTAALAQNVPVNTRPLDKVDEELIASGIIAGPARDSLTSSVPVATSVEERAPEPISFTEPETEIESIAPQAEPQPFMPLPAPVTLPEPRPQSASVSAPVIPAGAPLPAATSDLPWANAAAGNGWEVELPATPPEATPAPAPNVPPADFFKPLAGGPSAGPAWATGGSRTPPPELPGARGMRGPSMGGGGAPVWGIGLAGLGVVVIALFIWHNSGQQNQLQEKVARWTGSLNEHTENLPPELGGVGGSADSNLVKPEGTFSMAEFHPGGANALLPPPSGAVAMPSGVSSTAQIDFADVPPEQAGQPIVADGNENMPEDVSLFAKFQQAVAEARAKKQGGIDASGTIVATTSAAGADGGALTPEKLKEELSAYRKSLTETPDATQTAAKAPAFEKDPAAYMDGKSSAAPDGRTASGALLPPPELYTNNPNKLPIVGEPVANAPARIRTLADFEVEPFAPEKAKVRIPRSLKPKIAATDFPTMQVLSYVPGRGIIAYTEGKEGVLLIGETMNGWELTNVTTELAEFRAGQKRHYITAND